MSHDLAIHISSLALLLVLAVVESASGEKHRKRATEREGFRYHAPGLNQTSLQVKYGRRFPVKDGKENGIVSK